MKIDHVDGGPFVLTLSLEEASIICYTVPSALSGLGGPPGDGYPPDHPLYMAFLDMQQKVLGAQLVPGSKDSLLAYGKDQARELVARVERTNRAVAEQPAKECPDCGGLPVLPRCPTCGVEYLGHPRFQGAETSVRHETQEHSVTEGSANT